MFRFRKQSEGCKTLRMHRCPLWAISELGLMLPLALAGITPLGAMRRTKPTQCSSSDARLLEGPYFDDAVSDRTWGSSDHFDSLCQIHRFNDGKPGYRQW